MPTRGRVALAVAGRPIEPRLVEPGTLHVHLDSGTGLKAVDFGGSSDPYVKLSCGEEQHVSSYISSNCSPVWHEDFTFRGSLRSLRTLTLAVHPARFEPAICCRPRAQPADDEFAPRCRQPAVI